MKFKTFTKELPSLRASSAHVISNVLNGKSLTESLGEIKTKVAIRDQATLQEICFGCTRWYIQIEAILNKLMRKSLALKQPIIHALLTVGIYQLMRMRIQSHAIINETVAACDDIKRSWAKGLVNAVLREFQRNEKKILASLNTDITIQESHPEWLVIKFKRAWGEARAKKIISNNNIPGPLVLRINNQFGDRESYLKTLDKLSIKSISTKYSPVGIRIIEPIPIDTVPNFGDGAVSVQDEAAQFAVPLLNIKSGQLVLDACCAPGGKTCHILEQQPNIKSLLSIDISKNRLEKVKENAKRLRLEPNLLAADICDVDTWWNSIPFDRILLDAPCSGTGVIRRNPDIKLLRKASDITDLATRQLQLISALWPTLKQNGVFLYATCSILPEENDNVIKEFMTSHKDASILNINETWGIETKFGRQLFPEEKEHDGFYYARLIKL